MMSVWHTKRELCESGQKTCGSTDARLGKLTVGDAAASVGALVDDKTLLAQLRVEAAVEARVAVGSCVREVCRRTCKRSEQ